MECRISQISFIYPNTLKSRSIVPVGIQNGIKFFYIYSLGAILGLEHVFANLDMLDLTAIDHALHIPGGRTVVTCVIVKTMPFAMVQMDPVLAHQDISERSMSHSDTNINYECKIKL